MLGSIQIFQNLEIFKGNMKTLEVFWISTTEHECLF